MPMTIQRGLLSRATILLLGAFGLLVPVIPGAASGLPSRDLGQVEAGILSSEHISSERTIDGVVQGVGAIGPGQTLRIPILGRAGIPNDGSVGAVSLNVTATSPTAPSYLTVFPTGQARPLASNLNFTPGQTIPNSVIAQVGADGSISVYNNDGSTHVIVDISGWFPTG